MSESSLGKRKASTKNQPRITRPYLEEKEAPQRTRTSTISRQNGRLASTTSHIDTPANAILTAEGPPEGPCPTSPDFFQDLTSTGEAFGKDQPSSSRATDSSSSGPVSVVLYNFMIGS
jgi:hypothetical protein